MKSPMLNSWPLRGMKFTLAVASALGDSAAFSVRLTSLMMNPGAPSELTLSKRSMPANSPRSATSPRVVDGRRQQVAHEHPAVPVRVFGEVAAGDRARVLDDADAVSRGGEEPGVDVTAHADDGPTRRRHLARLVEALLEIENALAQVVDLRLRVEGNSGVGVGVVGVVGVRRVGRGVRARARVPAPAEARLRRLRERGGRDQRR